MMNDQVVLYNDNVVVNDYNGRKGFLMKMQALDLETKTLQERLKTDAEIEAVRIVSEYGTKKAFEQVDLGVYLMSMFGYNEASKYLNKFVMGNKKQKGLF